jgi:hypothetical protein
MAKFNTVSLVLVLLVMTILNGAKAARIGLIDHQLDKGFDIREYCRKDFKPYVCLYDPWLCYECNFYNSPPPPSSSHKIP